MVVGEASSLSDMNTAEETSRLVSSNTTVKPSYMNMFSNICAITFIIIISYCCFQNGITLFSFHPILMSVGWLLLMTTAINAITPGDAATEWMPIRLRSARHWVIQLGTGILCLSGFTIIVINKYINEKPHFVTNHAKLGLSSIIFMIITMLGGLCALYSLNLKQYLAPIYMKLLHSFVGLSTFTLGTITIILGIYSSWFSFGEYLRYICLFVVLNIIIFTILRPTLKIYFRLKEKLGLVN